MKALLALPILFFLTFSACTKKEEAPPAPAAPAGVTAAAGKVGVLTGVVTAKGKGTSPEPVRMNADPYCSKYWQGKTPTLTKVEVSSTGALKGAVVYLKNAPKGTATSSPVTLDQKGCVYEPQVLALQVNQTLLIKNSDATLHNVHALPKTNSEFNFGMASAGLTNERKFSKPEVGIRVKCDVHGWMSASVSVFDHPFFAVTDEKGNFEIKDIPEGKYDIEAYHSILGNKSGSLEVSGSKPNQLQIDF